LTQKNVEDAHFLPYDPNYIDESIAIIYPHLHTKVCPLASSGSESLLKQRCDQLSDTVSEVYAVVMLAFCNP